MSNPRFVPEKAKDDLFVNRLPLTGVVAIPFVQSFWANPTKGLSSTAEDFFVNRLPLLEERGEVLPFNQFDWANPALALSSTAARDFMGERGGSVGPIPPSLKGFEWLARARRRNRR